MIKRHISWRARRNKRTMDTKLFKAADGRFHWIGIFSNSFEDRDFPPEIIESQAHKDFVARGNSGEVPMPTLFVAHNPAWVLGTADFLTYDEVEPGIVFPIAFGTIEDSKKGVAEALMELECTMSHGMPYTSMKRVITRYDSVEVSITPKGVQEPANPLTSWRTVFNNATGKTTDEETIMIQQLRDKLVAAIGEQNVAALEGENKSLAEAAKAQNIAYKAQDTQPEDVAETMEPEAVEESAPVTEVTEAAEAQPVHVEPAPQITAEQIGEAISVILEPFKASMEEAQREQIAALLELKSSLEARVQALEADLGDVRKQAGHVTNKNGILEAYVRATTAAKTIEDAPPAPEPSEAAKAAATRSYTGISFLDEMIAAQRGQ